MTLILIGVIAVAALFLALWIKAIKERRDLDRHSITNCWMAYYGSADPNYYQIPCKLLPDPYL